MSALSKHVMELVGGRESLRRDIRDPHDLVALIRDGVPTAAVDALLAQGYLTLAELDRVVISRKTLYHRRRLGHLTAEQSDRLLRVVRILALTDETFARRDKAAAWLRRPSTALAGERPLDLLDTDDGARQVETLLGRIAHGIAA